MEFSLYIILSLIIPIFVLLGIIVVKLFAGKGLPDHNYTPVDQLLGQTSLDFHEEKIEQEQEDEHGDDKYKNLKKRYKSHS